MKVINVNLNNKTHQLKEFIGHSLLCILCGVSLVQAQEITIDGDVTELEWSAARQFELEYEVLPARNGQAKLKTIAFLRFDKQFLYVAFKAYGDPKKIRATIKDRDTSWMEDYVALMADPYGDGRYGILVGLNAMGLTTG